MEKPTLQSSGNAARGEEWFLSQLELSPLPTHDLVSFLDSIRQEGQAEQADQWAELLTDTLIEKGDVQSVLLVLRVRSSWHPATSTMSAKWKAIAQTALGSDSERKSFVRAGAIVEFTRNLFAYRFGRPPFDYERSPR